MRKSFFEGIKIENQKCTNDAWCTIMLTALNDSYYQKGLCPVDVINHETGTTRCVGVKYCCSANDRGIMLNTCPWCGEKINFI